MTSWLISCTVATRVCPFILPQHYNLPVWHYVCGRATEITLFEFGLGVKFMRQIWYLFGKACGPYTLVRFNAPVVNFVVEWYIISADICDILCQLQYLIIYGTLYDCFDNTHVVTIRLCIGWWLIPFILIVVVSVVLFILCLLCFLSVPPCKTRSECCTRKFKIWLRSVYEKCDDKCDCSCSQN